MSARAKPASSNQRQRDRIQRIGARLFAKRGYEAVGVAELGAAVGLGRGALYHHIGSKESLLYEISLAHVTAMVAFGEDVMTQDLPVDQKFRRLARHLMTTIAENLPELIVFFSDHRSLTGKYKREVMAMRTRFESIWADLLEQGAREHIFREESSVAVKGILGMFNYSYLWLRPGGELTPEQIADLFCDLVLQGLMLHQSAPPRG